MIVLIAAIIGNASGGNPYRETINISPIIPPPGIAPITVPTNRETTSAIANVFGPSNSMLKIPNKKAILIRRLKQIRLYEV